MIKRAIESRRNLPCLIVLLGRVHAKFPTCKAWNVVSHFAKLICALLHTRFGKPNLYCAQSGRTKRSSASGRSEMYTRYVYMFYRYAEWSNPIASAQLNSSAYVKMNFTFFSRQGNSTRDEYYCWYKPLLQKLFGILRVFTNGADSIKTFAPWIFFFFKAGRGIKAINFSSDAWNEQYMYCYWTAENCGRNCTCRISARTRYFCC